MFDAAFFMLVLAVAWGVLLAGGIGFLVYLALNALAADGSVGTEGAGYLLSLAVLVFVVGSLILIAVKVGIVAAVLRLLSVTPWVIPSAGV